MRVLAIAVSGAEAALRLARSRERRDRKGRKALTRATRARAKPALRMVVPETADQAESREAVEASPRCSRLTSIPSSVPIRRSAGVSWPALLLMGTLLGIEVNREQRGDASTASLDSAWSAVSGTTIRRAGLALALVALVSAFLPFLSLRYLDLARLNAASAPETAIANTRMAERFNPFSPQPPLARAYVYRTQNPADLEKAVRAQEEAVEKEPQNWLLNYRAALAIWEYRDALEGEREGSAATDPDARSAGAAAAGDPGIRELEERAKRYLQKAMELNPGGVELRSSAVY